MAEHVDPSVADQIIIEPRAMTSAELLASIKIEPQVAPRPLEIKLGEEVDLGIRVLDRMGQPEAIDTAKEGTEMKQGVAALLAVISVAMIAEQSGIDLDETLQKLGILPGSISLEVKEDGVLTINSGDLVMEITEEDVERGRKPDIEIEPEDLPRPAIEIKAEDLHQPPETIEIKPEDLAQQPEVIVVTEDQIHEAVVNGILPAENLREGFERVLTRLGRLGRGPRTIQDIFRNQE